ncbi:MAG: pur operon repressor [Clostridia bacterium]
MNSRMSRSERVAFMTARLVANPSRLFGLGDFARELGVARSTVSEDLSLIKGALDGGAGRIQTLPGAAGGVLYIPSPSAEHLEMIRNRLVEELEKAGRMLPGGFLYMTDLIFSPRWAEAFGTFFASYFEPLDPDAVVTIETKGIPLALMTARVLAKPPVIIRRNSRVTEGSSVSINYVSGSSQRIQTMSLPRRALTPGSQVVVVDDFLRGGGTVSGARDLLAEFEVEVLGTGVIAATAQPQEKLLESFISLVVIHNSDSRNLRVESSAPDLPGN